jgi:hypothetical protein
VVVIGQRENGGRVELVCERRYDLKRYIPSTHCGRAIERDWKEDPRCDAGLNAVMPDWQGRLWASSSRGRIVVITAPLAPITGGIATRMGPWGKGPGRLATPHPRCVDGRSEFLGIAAGPARRAWRGPGGLSNSRSNPDRYAWISGHLDGAVSGAVLNGYARAKAALDAWIDPDPNSEEWIFGLWREVRNRDARRSA